jgi:hypothetical protein
MALTPTDKIHALQIQAGVIGRKAGHAFEDAITSEINALSYPAIFPTNILRHVSTGSPAEALLSYVASVHGASNILHAVAISTGALATSEDGKKWLEVNGIKVRRCKSDIILTLRFAGQPADITIGVSTKQCNNRTPTNAQLFFTTARGFANLLQSNGIEVSDEAVTSLRKFCGDVGFRPLDNPSDLEGRQSDPRRYFWEEIGTVGRLEWEHIFSTKQDNVTRLLLQKAYLEDPFSPDLVLHKTKKPLEPDQVETAIYTIDELIAYSAAYGSFSTKPYSVRKGSFKDPTGVKHQAPRFGIVQMQRGGQEQHPNQLQFNLEAGYFYKIIQERS